MKRKSHFFAIDRLFIEIWTQSDMVYDWMARCRVPNTTAKTRVMSNVPMEVNGMAWCSVTANMDKRSSEKPPTRRKSFTNNVSTRGKPICRTVSCIGGWTQETRQEKAQASLWKYVLDITLGYSSYLYVLVTYYVTYLWNEKGALLAWKFLNVIQSGRVQWLPHAERTGGAARVVGKHSHVIHHQDLVNSCPNYFNATQDDVFWKDEKDEWIEWQRWQPRLTEIG